MHEETYSNGVTKKQTALLIAGGALAGAALGVLFAPASGEDTRRRLRLQTIKTKDAVVNTASDLKRRSTEFANTAADTAQSLVDSGRSRISQEKERISGAIEAGKRTYREHTTDPLS